MRLSTSLASLALFPSAFAARIAFQVSPSTVLPNPSTLPPSTHATLYATGHTQTAPLTISNSFVFSNVSAGSYLVTVQCRDYVFEPLRVDVSALETGNEKVQVWQTFRGNEWDNFGEKKADENVKSGDGLVVTEIRCLGGKEYYQSRGGFSAASLLKNPMILMAGFSMLMVFGMPKLMENMDEETKAEYEAMRKQGGLTSLMAGGSVSGSGPGSGSDTASKIQNFDMASWLAGKSNEAPSSGSEAQAGNAKKR